MLNKILEHKTLGAVLCKSENSTVATILVLDQTTLKPIPTGKLNIWGDPRYETRVTKKTNLSTAYPYTTIDKELRKKIAKVFQFNCGTGEHTEQWYHPYHGDELCPDALVNVYIDVDWKERVARVTPYGRQTFIYLNTFLHDNFQAFLNAVNDITQDGINNDAD